MTSLIYTKTFNPPQIDKKEILRYAGVLGESHGTSELLDECLEEIKGCLVYKVCYSEYPISVTNDAVDLGFTVTSSNSLNRNLRGCSSIILFAATIGLEIDRLIARYTVVSPAKALLFQAIGTERIEGLCDAFCNELSEQMSAMELVTRPRFSPGYGDAPIEMQRDIFTALDCHRKIGVALNESLLMSPTKSVTAIIGIGK